MNKAIKKISVKTVFGKIDNALRAKLVDGNQVPVMQIIGRVVAVKEKDTDYGKSVGLLGLFRATNSVTGEVFEAPVAWLPDVVSMTVAAAIEPGRPAELAAEILVQASDSPVGYEYVARALLSGGENDPLAALAAKVGAAAPQLAAPKAAEPPTKGKRK